MEFASGGLSPRAFFMAWIYLLVAGLLEIVWAIGMKQSEGFTRPGASLLTIVFMVMSFALLALAMKSLPAGTAYAIWTGIGAAGVAVIGMLFLGEPRDLARILCLLLIVSGVIGLKIFAKDA